MLLSKCALYDSKKSKFIKEQGGTGLLSSLEIETQLMLVGLLLFQSYQQVNTRYKMNEIANTFLLAGDKFVSEMHVRQPAALEKSGFT